MTVMLKIYNDIIRLKYIIRTIKLMLSHNCVYTTVKPEDGKLKGANATLLNNINASNRASPCWIMRKLEFTLRKGHKIHHIHISHLYIFWGKGLF